MKTFYNVEAQMAAYNYMSEELVNELGQALGFKDTDIDEREWYMFVAVFNSETTPEEMLKDVRRLLDKHPEILYFDVIYRYDGGGITKRFVLRNDGTIQKFIGHIVFEEVN